MRDFDLERQKRKATKDERTFVIGGQEFVLKTGIHPSVLAEYDEIQPDSTIEDTLRIVDRLITEMIEPYDDSAARYVQVREDKADPVTLEDLQLLVEWMVSTQTGQRGPNPTSEPDDSSTGPQRTTPSSTGDSLQPVLTAERTH